MTVNERKKRKAIRMWIVRGLFGPIAAYCLVVHIMGSYSTNIQALAAKYPGSWSKHMALGMAISIAIPFFLQAKNYMFRLLCSGAILLSSVMAINTMTQKEIVGAEERLKNDTEYKILLSRWQGLEEQYNKAQASVEGYVNLQLTSKINWNYGSRATRITRDSLFSKKERAWAEVSVRKKLLEEKGSESYEAYVVFFASILPLSKQAIMNSSNILLSLVNDLGIILYASVLVFLFGKWIMIPVPNTLRVAQKDESLVRGMFGKVSEIVRRIFGIRSEEKREPRCLHGTMLQAGVVILGIYTRMKEQGESITLKEIGRLAAKEMEKFRPKLPDGDPLPYSVGFVSEICSPRGRYRKLLDGKAGVC